MELKRLDNNGSDTEVRPGGPKAELLLLVGRAMGVGFLDIPRLSVTPKL